MYPLFSVIPLNRKSLFPFYHTTNQKARAGIIHLRGPLFIYPAVNRITVSGFLSLHCLIQRSERCFRRQFFGKIRLQTQRRQFRFTPELPFPSGVNQIQVNGAAVGQSCCKSKPLPHSGGSDAPEITSGREPNELGSTPAQPTENSLAPPVHQSTQQNRGSCANCTAGDPR